MPNLAIRKIVAVVEATLFAGRPRARDILVKVAVTGSGRPLPRVGGPTADGVMGRDGLRGHRKDT